MRLLSEMVFHDRQPTAQEIGLFADIALAVLPRASVGCRVEVATALAGSPGLPRSLLDALASDVPEVARPILAAEPGFSDDDLIAYAEHLTPAHRVAIAIRQRLAERVSDALIRLGDKAVLHAIADNLSAELSDWGAGRLVDESAGDGDLCRLMARREDLCEGDADRIVLLLAKHLRHRSARPASEPEPVAAPAAPAFDMPAGKTHLDVAELLARLKAGSMSLDDVLVVLAKEDRYNDVAKVLAVQAEIDEMSVLKVLVRADANGVINVARALEVGEATWLEIVKLRQRRLKFSDVQRRFEKEDFVKLTPAQARQTLAQFTGKAKKAVGAH